MNRAKYLIYLIGLVFIFSSCEEVININLNEAEPSLVVESLVTDSLAPYFVRLTTTKSFFSADPAPFVSNAFVTISDDAGNLDTLQHLNNGIYLTKGLKKGVVNRKYTLKIIYKSKNYTATSLLRSPMIIDSVTSKFVKGNGFVQPKGYYLTVHGKDQPGKDNFFLIKVARNDTALIMPIKYVTDGDMFVEEGTLINADLPYTFRQGDTAKVDFLSITENFNKYLVALQNQLQAGGTPFDPQPANLPTNISGGAFGYFVTAGILHRKLVIK